MKTVPPFLFFFSFIFFFFFFSPSPFYLYLPFQLVLLFLLARLVDSIGTMAFIIQYTRLRKHVNRLVEDMTNYPPTADNNNNDTSGGDNLDLEKRPSKTVAPYTCIPGISVEEDHNGEQYFRVGWDGAGDPFNPREWSNTRKILSTMYVCLIALITTMASAIDAAILVEASKEFGVAEVVESLATGIYLIGFGCGALVASPLSEIVGRYPVYLGALVAFGCWLLGAALAPNIGAQLAFRFLAGLMGSAPLTVAGGSIADIWDTLQKTFGFPLFAIPGFGGPLIGMSFFLCCCCLIC